MGRGKSRLGIGYIGVLLTGPDFALVAAPGERGSIVGTRTIPDIRTFADIY